MSEVDGRRARGARNRDAVVTAILELLREGNPDPGAHEIAERSGVSVRSVFRHFDDLESLYEAAVEQMVERSRDLYQPPPAKGSTEARVRALVDQRAALYEDITPTRLAAERLRGRSAAIAQNLGRAHAFLRDQAEAYLADDLAGLAPADRRAVLDGLDAALSWPAWHQLRSDQGLSSARATAATRQLVLGLLVVR